MARIYKQMMLAGITSNGNLLVYFHERKAKRLDLRVASDVENSDLDEQSKNLSRFLLELRRMTKLY